MNTIGLSSVSSNEMLRPPINHYMKVLDRSAFNKRVKICAAKIYDYKQIAQCRKALASDVLKWSRYPPMINVPENEYQNLKALLLKPEIKAEDRSTWSPHLQGLVDVGKVAVIPHGLDLSYDDYTYNDIMDAIIPKDGPNEMPTGFSTCGHIAHLNLRDQWLPYKTLIANVLLDKNPNIRSVINKTEPVGEQSEYRTFAYELLAGTDDMEVEHSEENCTYQFDFSKVYWNSRLNNEHRRLVKLFCPGEAVCDVMAGVGPFAVPAGKKKVFVWANDLNPDCYLSLKGNIKRNKVSRFVRAFNEDGNLFIRNATKSLLRTNTRVTINAKTVPGHIEEAFTQPKTFDHYIMNLPQSAISFLPHFISLYEGHESLFTPQTDTKLPLIHLYCFLSWNNDHALEKAEKFRLCEIISQHLRYELKPEDPEVDISFVRAVSPSKAMYNASFRLPAEVAFRKDNQ